MSDPAIPTPRRGIDPRGPRFAAGITSVLLLVVVFLGLTGLSTAQAGIASFGWFAYQPLADATFVPQGWAITQASIAQRVLDPAFLLLLVAALLFLWGVVSPRTAPWGVLYRRLVAPRLAPPTELEDPRPPRFAQGVGLLVSVIGLVLQLFGVPWGLTIAAAAAFIAAFLNAVFGLCLGCQLYLVLQRAGIVGRERPAAA
ncbi:DUF4395 domain-containing protein [Microbacterium allomyrinae]|jgi:hypothetical protein|uniref:DUF4395 domain-containing protein n=1 Tax=Microbacterium allomyrinae TaxID=2830666 RepID=A0A9X1LXD1_9MICO|nr:DUF4395 domain-containing protein [Microbacterium allomyrinae]MCC2033835.1 DUF4395 domain-containing protein [Microbacterium allomyrinae]